MLVHSYLLSGCEIIFLTTDLKLFIQDTQKATVSQISDLIRDESHLFGRKLIDSVHPAVRTIGDDNKPESPGCTVFGVLYKDKAYVVTAGHCISSTFIGIESLPHDFVDIALVKFSEQRHIEVFKFLNLSHAVADVKMTDPLIAYGFGEVGSRTRQARVWTGVAYAVYDNSTKSSDSLTILAGGDQVFGMSGCPTFNGCGLVGIASSLSLSKQENYTVKSGVEVVHVKCLLNLLNKLPRASRFSYPYLPSQVVTIPQKGYCMPKK